MHGMSLWIARMYAQYLCKRLIQCGPSLSVRLKESSGTGADPIPHFSEGKNQWQGCYEKDEEGNYPPPLGYQGMRSLPASRAAAGLVGQSREALL